MKKVKLVVTKWDSDLMRPFAELLSKQDHKTMVLWAADCAEHVLPYFEENYPKDNRPRKAIEAGRAWVRGDIMMSEARVAAFAAHAAAGHAAATAHVVSHAVHAANYAVTATNYATDSTHADNAITKERDWQYQHLLT